MLEPSDADLLRLAGRGDDRAFHALVDRHGTALYQAAMSFVGRNVADAEDLVQETLIAAYRGSEGLCRQVIGADVDAANPDPRAHRAWRRGRHRGATRSLDTGETPGESPINDPALANPGATAGVDQRIDILHILSELTDPHREVLVMREIWSMSYDEIAAALNVPRGTVESRLSRARAQVRQRFEGEDQNVR